jgi:hypothetical protein
MSDEDVSQKIANIIGGYRDGEFGNYDINHVNRWISQFEDDEKEIVLLETHKLLKRNYITRENFSEFINLLIDSDSVYRGDKDSYWKSVSILNIQKNGNSQKELNEILRTKINKTFQGVDFTPKDSGEYIYLDDFIFSGNRLYSDMEDWIKNFSPDKSRVCIITIGWFIYGQYSTDKKLKELAKKHKKDIEFSFSSYTQFRLENRLYRKDYSEVFWPTNSIENINGYTQWLESENFDPKPRTPSAVKNEVFSNSRREEYEKIIFKYGLKIIGFSANNNFVVKPLGYSTFRGFGFGSTVFSFRNCPNNNPLAFWWGDPSARPSHPFSKWYPLLQRKTYAQ